MIRAWTAGDESLLRSWTMPSSLSTSTSRGRARSLISSTNSSKRRNRCQKGLIEPVGHFIVGGCCLKTREPSKTMFQSLYERNGIETLRVPWRVTLKIWTHGEVVLIQCSNGWGHFPRRKVGGPYLNDTMSWANVSFDEDSKYSTIDPVKYSQILAVAVTLVVQCSEAVMQLHGEYSGPQAEVLLTQSTNGGYTSSAN